MKFGHLAKNSLFKCLYEGTYTQKFFKYVFYFMCLFFVQVLYLYQNCTEENILF